MNCNELEDGVESSQTITRNISRRAASLMLASFISVSAQVSFAYAEDLSQLLYRSTIPNAENSGREVDSDVLIRAFIREGYLKKKPESRQAYSDYRRVRKPFDFLGAKPVVLEEQYMESYIGCCVNPGIGLVLETSAESLAVSKLAKTNGCKYSDDPNSSRATLDTLGLGRKPGLFDYVFFGEQELQETQ